MRYWVKSFDIYGTDKQSLIDVKWILSPY